MFFKMIIVGSLQATNHTHGITIYTHRSTFLFKSSDSPADDACLETYIAVLLVLIEIDVPIELVRVIKLCLNETRSQDWR
jgi:hypothetical protein